MGPRQYVALRISNDAEAVPTVSDIAEGELAINVASERVYLRFGDVIRDITDRYTRAEIDDALSQKASAAHTHKWGEVEGKPEAFPPSQHKHGWGEVTGKPETFPPAPHAHSWDEVEGKPEAFPPSQHAHSWDEVESKPADFPASPHTHTLNQITDAGSAASAERGDFEPYGAAQRAAKEARQYVDSRPDPLLMHFI